MAWAQVVVIAICLLAICDAIHVIQSRLNSIYEALNEIGGELEKMRLYTGVIARDMRKEATDDD